RSRAPDARPSTRVSVEGEARDEGACVSCGFASFPRDVDQTESTYMGKSRADANMAHGFRCVTAFARRGYARADGLVGSVTASAALLEDGGRGGGSAAFEGAGPHKRYSGNGREGRSGTAETFGEPEM